MHIILLPHTHADPATWSALVAASRAFRLQSLRTAPESFASTYAREVAFESSVWHERLRNPLAHTFVAVSDEATSADGEQKTQSPADAQDEAVTLVAARWVGMIVVMGPREECFVQSKTSPWDTLNAKSSSATGQEAPEPAVLYHHMNAVFIDPDYRGQGIGRALIEEAYQFAARQSRLKNAARMCCTILVDQGNTAASKLYQKCGFKIVAEETMLSPRKERVDGTPIRAHDIQVVIMERWTDHGASV